MAPLSYHEAKRVLEQQKLAEEVMNRYEKLSTVHEKVGFHQRRELIRVLEDMETEERRLKGGGGARGARGLPPETVERIQQLKSEGKSNAEISRQTGTSPITVAKYVGGGQGKKIA